MPRILPLVVFSLALAANAQTRLRVMEWNVENLFDTRHDTLKRDEEFLPGSSRRWTPGRYWKKLNEVAQTVMAVGETGLPDLVALCEVENDSVMQRLTRKSAMGNLGYRYVMTSSPDVRGIDCALMFQPLHFGLIGWWPIRVPSQDNGFRPTRDILYAKGRVGEDDTLHVLVCHLPSQLGGSAGRRHRQLAVATLQAAVDSLRGRHVLVMGDCNTPDIVIDGMRGLKAPGGTYRYQGKWEQLDHILLSPSLAADTLYTGRFPFLLEEDEKCGGDQPRRTYLGPAYRGGISDHLPLWADVIFTSPGTR